jgi:predicted TIM-barrel fold metal-dependent hydrolase
MATTDSGDRYSSLDQLDVVVDADSHFTETVGDILPFVDETRHGAAKKLMEASDLKLNEVYSLTVASPGFAYAAQSDTIEDTDDSASSPEGHVERKLDTMEEHGITHAIINPTLNLVISSVNNTRFAVALANAYNSWVLDVLEDAPETITANMSIAPQKPSKAAEEIDRRADEDRFVGVQLVASGLVPPPGHEWYNPIYEAAEANDLPVSMHSGVGQTPKSFPIQFYWNETFAADHAIGHPFSHMWNLTSMLFEGVPERYDVDFVYQEAGLGYVPFMMGRLDDHYLEMSYELPALEQLPSEYIRDQFYFCTQPLELTPRNPEHIAYFVEMIGEESVLYSGDFPHPDFDPPEELFDRVCGFFEADTTEQLMGKGAADVYGLNL